MYCQVGPLIYTSLSEMTPLQPPPPVPRRPAPKRRRQGRTVALSLRCESGIRSWGLRGFARAREAQNAKSNPRQHKRNAAPKTPKTPQKRTHQRHHKCKTERHCFQFPQIPQKPCFFLPSSQLCFISQPCFISPQLSLPLQNTHQGPLCICSCPPRGFLQTRAVA